MPDPRMPANDFERWLAASRVPPDERDPDSLCEGIAAALRSHEIKAVPALIAFLARRDLRKARTVHDMILAACEGGERRAVLLAALG